MEHIWSPWRMQFIDELRARESGCIFCELMVAPSPEFGKSDKDRLILYRGKHCFVLMNRFPYNNGHLLIVPFKHTGKMTEISGDEYAEMMALCAKSQDIMSSCIEAQGFNCGFNIGRLAGAGVVDHIHLHVVPRWLGDSNFMPIISDTRSMPEYLSATYDRIKPGFDKIAR